MSLSLISVLIAADVALLGGGERTAPSPPSLGQLQDVRVAHERPRLVLILRSGVGHYERASILLAAPRHEARADGPPAPVWWARRIEWDARGTRSTPDLSGETCPAVTTLVQAFEGRAWATADLPTRPAAWPDGAPPPPPVYAVHQNFTLWTRARGVAGEPLAVTIDGLGGPIAEAGHKAIQEIAICADLSPEPTSGP